MRWTKDEYTLDDNEERLDLAGVVDGLQTTYWARNRSASDIIGSWAISGVVLGIYKDDVLVGWGRVVTDFVAIAYLADVYIEPEHRGLGLGTWLTQSALAHAKLATCKWLLHTKDAHEVYRRAGFTDPDARLMQYWPPAQEIR